MIHIHISIFQEKKVRESSSYSYSWTSGHPPCIWIIASALVLFEFEIRDGPEPRAFRVAITTKNTVLIGILSREF